MASGISGAGRLREDVDYSVPHRPAPALPPNAYDSNTARRRPSVGNSPYQTQQQQHYDHVQQQHSLARDREPAEKRESPRKNSLSGLLRRPSRSASSAQARAQAQAQALSHLPASPTKINNTFLHYGPTSTITSTATATPPNDRAFDDNTSGNERGGLFRRKSSTGSKNGNMLRKSSKAARQQQANELERQRQAQLLPKQPPQLPSHSPLPTMTTFGGEDARPDSVAMFNQGNYKQSRSPPNVYTSQAANFSRPGFAAMGVSATSNHSSSSPAYATRGASASATPPAAGATNGHHVSNGERTASMTNRGRYSFASSTGQTGHVNSPRRIRRRKDPTPFNVLLVGAKNSGKSSFISFLQHSLAVPSHKADAEPQPQVTKGAFTSTYVETEFESERVGLTLWDSAGLDQNVVDLQLREMTNFIESKFEDTFAEEQKVMRSPGFKDTHIHCVFLILDPVRLDATIAGTHRAKGGAVDGAFGLNEDVDMQVLRALWGKTTVIPIISKADTLTIGHMNHLKRAVWQSIKSANLNPLEALELEDDSSDELEEVSEEDESPVDTPAHSHDPNESVIDDLLDRSSDEEDDAPAPKPSKRISHARTVSSPAAAAAEEEPYLPMSILSPDPYDLPPYAKPNPNLKPADLGRRFPWGFASPLNPEHCDYVRLRDSIFSEWRTDLRELSRVKWYEQWRTSRLRNVPGTKQRVKGGVTPLASVPKEGRSSPNGLRSYSAGNGGVPRSISGGSAIGGAVPSVGMAVSTPPVPDGMRAAY